MAAQPEKRIACLLIGSTLPEGSLEALAEASMRWSPQVALRSGEAVFIEIGGSRNLFSEESFIAKMRVLASRFDAHSVRIAIADTAGAALALARHSVPRIDSLPLESFVDFLNPFATLDPDLKRPLEKMLHALRSLGLSKIGEFTSIPVSEITPRFGKQACEIHAAVRGRMEPAWEGFHPPERILETIEAVAGGQNGEICADLESLIFILKAPVDRAMARLRGRAQRAARVSVTFELELWSTIESPEREFSVSLALPQGASAGLLPILQERLMRSLEKEPLGSPVRKIRFEVLETVPGRDAQRDFFSRKEEEDENWDALVARLSERFGKERVFVAETVSRYLPEKAYAHADLHSRAARSQKAAGPQLHLRPSRILKSPERLLRSGRTLGLPHPDGKTLRANWQATTWEGPERLSGEWWSEEDRFERDYYRVTSERGEQLWVYVSGEAVYLHGYFD